MPKVIFFVTSLQSGGLENYLLRFLLTKHQKFCQITVFCKGGIGGQLEERYQSIPNVHIIKRKLGFFNPIDYWSLSRYLKKYKYDAVCDFTGNFAGRVMLAAKRAGVENRITFYRGSSDRFHSSALKSLYNKWVKGLVYKHATSILSNSKAALNHYYPQIWNDDKRFEVIYNGINATQFTSVKSDLREEFEIPKEAFVVGHTGRFSPAKNHETILKVALDLVQNYQNIYFILCGNHVALNLRKKINEMGLSDRILVFDNRLDIPQFLKTMDCYFFPSLTEGQPNALIEAMLMDLPIVASNIEPIKETVPQEAFSFLVDPKDVEKAKEKILDIYTNGNRQQLQEWAKANFQAEKLFNQFYNHF